MRNPLQLLEATVLYLQENPDKHTEYHWHDGTVGGIAGWLCVFAGAAINGTGLKTWATYHDEDIGIYDLARQLLTLDRPTANAIFIADTKADALAAARAYIADRKEHHR